MTAGDVETVAGSGALSFFGDGGPGVNAALDHPSGVAVDGASLLIADYLNERIRKLTG